ncbi:uncharacterized protein B0H64DRAFT_444388 [Chaetomium fimeti]|uniref:Secreted protein n=1 Tax=Chaetomium fimeti TaxID=1854472 RepID=A0AAE0HAP6_9PEZI|nr:hypothetical protein B0H64DRAFT_444388 [Chaetomium fimeti]
MKPVTAIIIAALAQSASVFGAADCVWHRCWKMHKSSRGIGWSGSEACEDKCPSERFRERKFYYKDSWGCRLDEHSATHQATALSYFECCARLGDEYRYDTYAC